jgi:plastocyanin
MPKFPALFLSVAALAVGLAGCGGSSSSSSSAASTSSSTATSSSAPAATSSAAATAAPSGSSTISLAANPGGMLMFDKSSLTAKAGTVTIKFTNSSPLGHNLTIQQGTSGPVVGSTPTFSGGTKTLTVKLKAGKYTYFCSVPGHRQGGMQGTLTVT